MTHEERESIMMEMSEEQRDRYRQFLNEARGKLKRRDGTRMLLKELIDRGEICVPVDVNRQIQAFAEQDGVGPAVGAPAIDFCVRRLIGEESVRLSNFRGRRPVAVIFGSYT